MKAIVSRLCTIALCATLLASCSEQRVVPTPRPSPTPAPLPPPPAVEAAAPSEHTIYTFTDGDGVAHFVDDLTEVPAKYRKNAKVVSQ